MTTSTKRIIRDLRREFPGAEFAFTGSGHIRVRYQGVTAYVSATPGKTHFLTDVRRDIKYKLLQKQKAGV